MRIRIVPTFFACMMIVCLAACNLPATASSPEDAAIATRVAATIFMFTRTAPQGPQPATAQPPTLTLHSTSTFTSTPTLTPTVGITSTPKPGSISGGIYGYPYGSLPSLTFVAFNQATSGYWYWVIPPGSSSYLTDAFISPGRYQVVAYDPSGHAGGCTTIVTVNPDQTSTCDITDWAGSYRSKPSGVP